MGIIMLILVCVTLAVALAWSLKRNSDQKALADRATALSNEVSQANASLDQLKQVNEEIEGKFTSQKKTLVDLTNSLSQSSANLQKSEGALKTAREQLEQKDTKIADLESQNQMLDQRAFELSSSITNLNSEITETKRRLAASEGDKAFLEKELQRMMGENAELERQFNDIKVLRAQVAKLKEEMNVSRRLDWIRKGVFASSEQKGAEQLMQRTPAPATARKPAYDLNVEINADGSVRVIPPLTNKPAVR
jgi:chromosome segregation ATPase